MMRISLARAARSATGWGAAGHARQHHAQQLRTSCAAPLPLGCRSRWSAWGSRLSHTVCSPCSAGLGFRVYGFLGGFRVSGV